LTVSGYAKGRLRQVRQQGSRVAAISQRAPDGRTDDPSSLVPVLVPGFLLSPKGHPHPHPHPQLRGNKHLTHSRPKPVPTVKSVVNIAIHANTQHSHSPLNSPSVALNIHSLLCCDHLRSRYGAGLSPLETPSFRPPHLFTHPRFESPPTQRRRLSHQPHLLTLFFAWEKKSSGGCPVGEHLVNRAQLELTRTRVFIDSGRILLAGSET